MALVELYWNAGAAAPEPEKPDDPVIWLLMMSKKLID